MTSAPKISEKSYLAFYGGKSIRSSNEKWPKWPVYSDNLINEFKSILDSRSWSISSNFNGELLRYEIFAEKFSSYNKTKYCVPTDHGSSAIIATLNSLGIGKGDEVILTGLTWVACPISILKVGAKPVIVDIDPATQCMDPGSFETAITRKTKAVLVVHLYSSMANMNKILSIAKRNNIIVIEDCAQAHGAEWQNKKAGSLGHIGVFSFQHGKPLACGEGGAIITSDDELYSRLQQATTHGRIFCTSPIIGHVRLEEVGNIIGGNMALPEFQAAILLDSLPLLDQMNKKREVNATYLDKFLGEIPGIIPIKPYEENNKRSYYHYNIRYDSTLYPSLTPTFFCALLESELHTWFHPTYPPLNQHRLFKPELIGNPNTYAFHELKNALTEHNRTLLVHHSILLGSQNDMDDIIAAFKKICEIYYTG